MPDKPEASRLRQLLRQSEQLRDQHLEVLVSMRLPLVRGSFVVLGKKCGKPNCRCAKGELHSSRYLSWSEGGRTRLVYVPGGDEMLVRQGSERYRRFREARAALAKLSAQVLAQADALMECLLEAYPPRRPRHKSRGGRRAR